jgi:hypothetical protein
MRRFICLSMVVLFFTTAITGFVEAHVHPGQSGIHTPLAVLFVIFAITHGALNRKAMAKHFASTAKKAE